MDVISDMNSPALSRRSFLASTGGALLAAAVPEPKSWAAATAAQFRISAGPGTASLAGRAHPETAVWSYNGRVPGPEIRVRQGQSLKVVVENRLGEDTTVHWHGLRVPNAMDGVPHLTQKPIAPGGTFTYAFTVPDAGTYWYHPHQNSAEQVGRGLYGPLIVEERNPIQVDRDLTWVLDDWRLKPDAQISGDFGRLRDISHGGRLGNAVTVNGRIQDTFAVRRGERVRLRLINTANARAFALEFQGHRPRIIAIDGQPVEPHEPAHGRVVLGAAMRVDLILDMIGKPGERFTVKDSFYRRFQFRLLDLVYGATPLRDRPPETPITLAANTLPEPDVAKAERHKVIFGGGMMGGMRTAMMDGRQLDIREILRSGKAWAINGVVANGKIMEPFLTLKRGRSYVLDLGNDTAWNHPMHLHGHSFRVIRRNGAPTRHREWQDTVMMAPRERVEIAFVADNPGDWMFHCHILEHAAGGMTGVIRVT